MSSVQSPSQLLSVSASFANDEIDLKELFLVLLAGKWTICIITCVFAIFGVLYAVLATPVHDIDAQLYIDNKAQPLTKIVSANVTQIINVPSLSVATEVEFLNAPQMRMLLIKKLHLVHFFEQKNKEMTLDDINAWLEKNLDIHTEKNRKAIINLSMQSAYLDLAPRIIDALIGEYVEQQKQRTLTSMQETLDVLDQNNLYAVQDLEAKAQAKVKVLSFAKVSKYPVQPKKTLIVVLATLLGGMVAVGFVLVTGAFSRGIGKALEIEHLGLTVLACLPKFNNKKSISDSDPLEALRFLRTSMQYQLQGKEKHIAMISATGKDVGKRFVSENLAVLEAKTGKKVLFIDADMRLNSLGERFTTDASSVSLAFLLKEDVFNAESINLDKTDVEHLSFIAAGKSSDNPAELLTKDSFVQLLEWANQTFDVVIVNTPAVLDYADACIIGEHIGVNILVARANHSTIDEVKDAVKQFNQSGVLVDGVVFNGVEG